MLKAAMRTYCRLLATSARPGPGVVVGSVACPSIRQGTGRVLHGVGQLTAALVASAAPTGRYRR